MESLVPEVRKASVFMLDAIVIDTVRCWNLGKRLQIYIADNVLQWSNLKVLC